jgi:putative DNA primase/helicase
LFRPDEKQAMRQIMLELRNGKSVPTKLVDKIDGRWQEMEPPSERIVRKDYGEKQDAERKRCHDVILQLIFDEAAKGNLYTPTQFSQVSAGKAGLGGWRTIHNRLGVLMTKGFIKFNMDATLTTGTNSKYGVMCVEDMEIPAGADPETGEMIMKSLLPTHFKESQTGAILPVENPEVWVYVGDA